MCGHACLSQATRVRGASQRTTTVNEQFTKPQEPGQETTADQGYVSEKYPNMICSIPPSGSVDNPFAPALQPPLQLRRQPEACWLSVNHGDMMHTGK